MTFSGTWKNNFIIVLLRNNILHVIPKVLKDLRLTIEIGVRITFKMTSKEDIVQLSFCTPRL